MPLNIQVFRTRAITAAIFVVVMLAGLLINRWSFFLLFTIIHFGCWWEYLNLAEKIHKTRFHPYTRLGFMLVGYGLMLLFCGPGFQVNNYSFRDNFSLPVSVAGFSLLVIGVLQKGKINLKGFGMAFLGLIYISLSWGLMMNLYGAVHIDPASFQQNRLYYLFLPLFAIVTMWVNDTMAYIVGSLIGKTPFSKISPKKTWEGTMGGIILAALITGNLGYSLDDYDVIGHSRAWWIGLSLLAAVSGTMGDLLESKLKRMAGVKDSGKIMPGHGGFLDRFDSLLVASIIVWLYVTLVRA